MTLITSSYGSHIVIWMGNKLVLFVLVIILVIILPALRDARTLRYNEESPPPVPLFRMDDSGAQAAMPTITDKTGRYTLHAFHVHTS